MNGLSEAQQRYFSYRVILVAIVSQNSFVLFFLYRAIIARYVATWGIAQMCLCEIEIKYHGGGIAPFWSEGRKWGVRSVVVEFGVFGAPRFSIQRPQTL